MKYYLKEEEGIPEQPYKRCRDNPENNFNHTVTGILIGFKYVLGKRKGWLDIITCNDTIEEIKDLIRKCGGDPEKYKP
jgi:hypothetical protein